MITVPTTFLQALAKVVERLDEADLNWAITGSLGFRLQGVPVDVNDIDLQTDGAGAYKIEDLLCEYSTEKVGFRLLAISDLTLVRLKSEEYE